MPVPTVELINSFLFVCGLCGLDTFVRGITVEPESLDPADFDDEISEWIDGGGEGSWMMAPESVTCGHCGAEFATHVD